MKLPGEGEGEGPITRKRIVLAIVAVVVATGYFFLSRKLGSLVRRKTELRTEVPGSDRLVRVDVDPGRDPHEQPLEAGSTRAGELLDRVEHDVCDGSVRGSLELLVRLVVPVHDQPPAGNARPLREAELTESRDVRAEPFLAE